MESFSSGSSTDCQTPNSNSVQTLNDLTPRASTHASTLLKMQSTGWEEEGEYKMELEEDHIEAVSDEDSLNPAAPLNSPSTFKSSPSKFGFRSLAPPQRPVAHEAPPIPSTLIGSPSPLYREGLQSPVTPQFNPISNNIFMISVTPGPEILDLTFSSPVKSEGSVSPMRRTLEEIAESKRNAQRKREAAAAAKKRDEQMTYGQQSLASHGFAAIPMTKMARYNLGNGVTESAPWIMDKRCTPEQTKVLDAIKNGSNVFFTGPAGTGKSFLMSEIRGLLGSLRKSFQVTATTGIAALAVSGITLHGFASLGLAKESIDTLYDKITRNKTVREKWTTTSVLIIDEISMCPTDFFCRLNILGKLVRKSSLAFGGIQIIVSGDFLQLPPVPDSNRSCIRCGSEKTLRDILPHLSTLPELSTPTAVLKCFTCKLEVYDQKFTFETPSWNELNFVDIRLTQVFRQAEEELQDLLNKIRMGYSDQSIIDKLTSFGPPSGFRGGIKPTNLYCTRNEVSSMNTAEFNQLKDPAHDFVCFDDADGTYPDYDKKRLKDTPAAMKLSLKIGTQVMLQANLNLKQGLVNGARGVIVAWVERESAGIESGSNNEKGKKREAENVRARDGFWIKQKSQLLPVVYFANSVQCVIEPFCWRIDLSNSSSVSRTQIPLAHGWSITIHKSQGQSLDAVAVRLETAFEAGQAYVALSRCRTSAGMTVEGVTLTTIRADPTVLKFYEDIAFNRPFLSGVVPPVNPLSFVQFPSRFSDIDFGPLPAPVIRAPPEITAISLTWEEHLELAIRGFSEVDSFKNTKESINQSNFMTKTRRLYTGIVAPYKAIPSSSQFSPQLVKPPLQSQSKNLTLNSSPKRGGPISTDDEAVILQMIAEGAMDAAIDTDESQTENKKGRKRKKKN